MTRCRDRTVLLTLLLLAAVHPARAGEPRAAVPGDRVRLDYREPVRKKILFVIPYTTRENRHVAGELVTFTADSVTIRRDGDHALHTRPLAGIDRLSVSTGTRRHLLGGTALGFVLGTVIATPIAATEDESGELVYDPNRGRAIVIGGTILGAVIGYLDVSDRWKKAELAKPAVVVAPAGDGRGIGFGIVCGF